MPSYPSGDPHQRIHQASVRCKNLAYSVGVMQYGCSVTATAEQAKQILPAQTFWPDLLTSTDCTQGSCSHDVNMTEQYKYYSLRLNDQQPLRITRSLSKHTELF